MELNDVIGGGGGDIKCKDERKNIQTNEQNEAFVRRSRSIVSEKHLPYGFVHVCLSRFSLQPGNLRDPGSL
jgi:hypothetical protein